jgi:hypothetical protein
MLGFSFFMLLCALFELGPGFPACPAKTVKAGRPTTTFGNDWVLVSVVPFLSHFPAQPSEGQANARRSFGRSPPLFDQNHLTRLRERARSHLTHVDPAGE